MKKLLIAAGVSVGLAASAVSAFAQSATTSQPGPAAIAENGTVRLVQALNYHQGQATVRHDAYVGRGSAQEYLWEQQELQKEPGYSVGGNG